jgi:prophage regulatory protein
MSIKTAEQQSKPIRQSFNFDSLPDSGFLRLHQLIPAVVPWSRATHWRYCKDKKFPQPVKLSSRVTAWRVGDVRAWMKSRVEVSAK